MKELPIAALFNKILDKYRLNRPVPPAVRQRIIKVKRKQYRKTVKRAGASSLLLLLVSHLFFFLKRCGVNVTMAQSAVITAALSAVTACLVSAGAYVAVSGLRPSPPERPEPQREAAAVPERHAPPVQKKDTGAAPERPARVSAPAGAEKAPPVPGKKRIKKGDFTDEPVDHMPGL